MALTPLHSAEYLALTAVPPQKVAPRKAGKVYVSSASLTFTAAGQGTAKMLRLPPGGLRIWKHLSRIICPVGTATADLHVGYAAHVNELGVAVVADDNAFADNLDVGGAAIDAAFSLPATAGYLDLNSQNGIEIEVLIDTANSPAAGEMVVAVAYTRSG